MDPPGNRGEMTWIPVHKTWQMNLLWQMDPQSIKSRCLEYQYTKLGRQTYFGWWTPLSQARIDALNTTTQNLADKPTLADGPLVNRGETTWIPVHKTWQTNLLWPMDPQSTWQTNLLWLMDPPQSIKNRCLEYHYTKLGRLTYFGRWTPWYGHIVVKDGNFIFLLTSSGQGWKLADLPADLHPQSHIATDI